jgi:2-oxoglutarate dehydrogenase complex dehydrogenase (E1) component-like enzyme
MYALISPKGYFTGYQFRNNQMIPFWEAQFGEFNFSLAVFRDWDTAVEEAKKHENCTVLVVSISQ